MSNNITTLDEQNGIVSDEVELTQTEYIEQIQEAVQESVQEAMNQDDEGPKYETVEKVTPGMSDLSWWIKWIATVFGIVGLVIAAVVGNNPQSPLLGWNIPFSLLGVIGWTWVGMRWRDNALIVSNVFAAGVLTMSVIQIIESMLLQAVPIIP